MNKSLKILFLYNGIFVLASSLLGPLYALYVGKLTPGILSVSISWAAFMISGTIFTYFVSKIKDNMIKHEYMLVISFLIRAFIWILFIFINSIPQLIILQILLGIGEAIGNPAFDSIFAEHLDKNKHISEYANWKVVEKLATAAATIFGGMIVTLFGFPSIFILMSILALIPSIGILIRPKVLE